MAEKILQTRIINKHADLATWKDSTLPLKTGEIALARVETTKPDGHGGFYKVPTYLMKVGDGEKTFSQLEWLAAPASDVYEWAKAATKPGYNATEIVRGTSTVALDLTAAEEAIKTLQAAVGNNGSVAQAIEAAINALDVEDSAVEKQFVTAVAEADGKISVTRRALTADDIPTLEIAKINGLQDALDLKATKKELGEAVTGINTTITGKVAQDIAAAKKAGDDAQDAIDAYIESNNAALEGVKATAEAATTVEEATNIADDAVSTFKTETFNPLAERVGVNETDIGALETAVANLAGTGRTSETVKGNADAIAELKTQIGSVANVMNFRGVSVKGEGTVPGHDIADPKAGDVILYGDAEYVYDESNAWVKFGDASDNAQAITDLGSRVGTIEARLNTGDIHEAITTAQNTATQGVNDAKAAKTYAEGVAGDLATEVARATKAEEDNLATAKSYAEEKASAAQTAATNAAKGYTDSEIAKVNETITSNATTAAAATKAVADDLAAYKTSNNAAVSAAQGAADAAQSAADAAQSYAEGVQDNLTDLIDGTVKSNTEAISANAGDIDYIEKNFAKVKTVDDVSSLVVGEAEDVIIFDCGGAV